MNTNHKPEGYPSLSPYFIVDGAQKLVDFLKAVFNATEKRRYDMPDGTIMHIELQIEDSIVMMGDASEKFPAIKQVVHLYLPDVDATFKKAIASGAEIVEHPKEREGDPDRRGTFKDIAGNMWSIATMRE